MQRHQLNKFIMIRNNNENDHAFLFATYLKNNWYDKTNTTTLKKQTWMDLQRKRLGNIIEKNHAIKIACLVEDPETILGYAFIDGDKPFLYVKLAWRNEKWQIKSLLQESLEPYK